MLDSISGEQGLRNVCDQELSVISVKFYSSKLDEWLGRDGWRINVYLETKFIHAGCLQSLRV